MAYMRIARNLIPSGIIMIIKYHQIPNFHNLHFNNMFFIGILLIFAKEIQKTAIIRLLTSIKPKISVSNKITVDSSIFC